MQKPCLEASKEERIKHMEKIIDKETEKDTGERYSYTLGGLIRYNYRNQIQVNKKKIKKLGQKGNESKLLMAKKNGFV